jgi:hypothetical protein
LIGSTGSGLRSYREVCCVHSWSGWSNGQPGLAVQRDDVIVNVMAFEVGSRIKHIWAVLNPGQAATGTP